MNAPIPASDTPLLKGAIAILCHLRDAGFETFFAGGCVRDWLLGRGISDIDIATAARPEQVESLFKRTIPVGKSFGVVQVVLPDGQYEIATFRADGQYADGRRPDSITFCSAREDAIRRDFTVNGMFADPLEKKLIDYVGGQADLEARTIRAIGDPEQRFTEDRLRMLRAVRFATTLGFTVEPRTLDAIRSQADQISCVSPERIGKELTRSLCEAQRPGDVLRLLDETNLLEPLLPEIAALKGCEQPPEFHPEGDVWTHTLLMLDGLPPSPEPALAWGVLLHDIGKPPTCTLGSWPDGRPRLRFNRHAEVGAEMTEKVLGRMRLSRKLTDAIIALVRNHMSIADAPKMRRPKLRRLIGRDTFDLELELHRLDTQSSHRDSSILEFLQQAQEEFANEPVLPQPWVTGKDLIAMGVKPGPGLGQLLHDAYDRQLAGECPNRDALLNWTRDRLNQSQTPS